MQESAKSGGPLQVIQFTDTHYFESSDETLMGVDTASTFLQVCKLAQQQHGAPNFYLLTGDLSQDETEMSYRRFARALEALRSPAYYLAGNHDSRELMQRAFSESAALLRGEKDFVNGPWQVILLDTQVPGKVHGHLCPEELERLDEALSAHRDLHALIALHHHPLSIGSAWMDKISLDNDSDLFKVIDKHPQVRGVICGHIHQEFERARGFVRFFGSPSTCVQFKPRSETFSLDPVPPGYRWLRLYPNGNIETAIVRVESVAAGLDMASLGY